MSWKEQKKSAEESFSADSSRRRSHIKRFINNETNAHDDDFHSSFLMCLFVDITILVFS